MFSVYDLRLSSSSSNSYTRNYKSKFSFSKSIFYKVSYSIIDSS